MGRSRRLEAPRADPNSFRNELSGGHSTGPGASRGACYRPRMLDSLGFRSIGALALAALALPARAQTRQVAYARTAVFRAAGFPTVDAPEIPAGVLDQAFSGLATKTFGSAAALRDGLATSHADALVMPYGS